MFVRHASVPLVLLAVPVLTGLTFEAQAVSVQPRVSVGYQDYDIGFEDVTEGNPDGTLFFRDGFALGDRLSFVGLGLTVTADRLFFDVSGQRSERGRDSGFQFQGTQTGFGSTPSVGHNHSLDARFDRDEYNATLGWGFSSNFSAYVGYKRATVDLRNHLEPVADPFPDFGDVVFSGERVIDFSYRGAFIGATYALPIERWGGAFAVQSSVAFLDGKFKDRFVGDVAVLLPFLGFFPLDPSFIDSTIRGKSRGLNVGLSWTGGFGRHVPNLSYTLGLDRSQYEFDTSQSTTGNFEEKNTRLRLDLRYRFNSDAN